MSSVPRGVLSGSAGGRAAAKRKAKPGKACAEPGRRAKARAAPGRAERERKVAARDKRRGRRKGKRTRPPREGPRPEEQAGLTDPGSALMRKNRRSEYRRQRSARAVVDAEGSQLVLGSRAGPCANDRGELVAGADPVPGALGSPDRALADNGHAAGRRSRNRGIAARGPWRRPGRRAGGARAAFGRRRRRGRPGSRRRIGPSACGRRRRPAKAGRAAACGSRRRGRRSGSPGRPWDSGGSRCAAWGGWRPSGPWRRSPATASDRAA